MAFANRSGGLTEEAVLNYFISGLYIDIKHDVVAINPINLLRVVALAKLYEEKYTSIPKPSPSYTNKFTTSSLYSTPYNSLPRNTLKTLPASKSTTQPGPQLKNPKIKRISPAEMQLRRKKSSVISVMRNFLSSINVLTNNVLC